MAAVEMAAVEAEAAAVEAEAVEAQATRQEEAEATQATVGAEAAVEQIWAVRALVAITPAVVAAMEMGK